MVHELGFDLPELDRSTTLWWCPGSYVARAAATGVTLPLLSPGPRWLASLPRHWLGREVIALPAAEAHRLDPGWFAKPAEVKVSALPAAVYADADGLVRAVAAAGLEPGSWLIASEPVEYVGEYRCFIADGAVTAVSPYLISGVTWDGFDPAAASSAGALHAAEFAQAVIDDIGPGACPPGFTLDVGADRRSRWSVIEANASWSSNPYHCDLAGVLASIEAAHDAEGAHARWAWILDPYQSRRARPLHRKEMP